MGTLVAGIGDAQEIHPDLPDHRALVTSGHVQVPAIAAGTPACGVLTRIRSATPRVEPMQKLVPLAAENGAMEIRYGTPMTGDHAGQRLLGVTILSLDTIEATDDAFATSAAHRHVVEGVEITLRTIVRFAG